MKGLKPKPKKKKKYRNTHRYFTGSNKDNRVETLQEPYPEGIRALYSRFTLSLINIFSEHGNPDITFSHPMDGFVGAEEAATNNTISVKLLKLLISCEQCDFIAQDGLICTVVRHHNRMIFSPTMVEHMMNEHNAAINPELLAYIMKGYLYNLPTVRPLTECDKPELVDMIHSLRETVETLQSQLSDLIVPEPTATELMDRAELTSSVDELINEETEEPSTEEVVATEVITV